MAKSIAELVNEKFGVRTRSIIDPDNVGTVGIGAERLLRANSMRYAFTLINLSPNDIHISPGAAVSATAGIRVAAGGGTVTVSWEEDFSLPSLEWFVIAAVAGSAIFLIVVEGEP